MTEYEYEKWFDEHLGDIESPHSHHSQLSPLCNVPKPLNKIRWLHILGFCMSGCTLISLLLSYSYNATENWLLDWLSNAFLNFSIGIISSIIILLYTTSAEKNNAFYSDIIPILKDRHRKLCKAYYSICEIPRLKYSEGKLDVFYEEWRRLLNVTFVILEFMEFLISSSKVYKQRITISASELAMVKDELLTASNKIDIEYFNHNTVDRETFYEALHKTLFSNRCLNALKDMITSLEQDLYRNKYGPEK